MKGTELSSWRLRWGYTQDELRKELGLGSRQTLVTWEHSPEDLPRTVILALTALEQVPGARRFGHGRHATAAEARRFDGRLAAEKD
jgi:DNA-binding XRE family transcriptional regulator